jgi:hypothetical protein
MKHDLRMRLLHDLLLQTADGDAIRGYLQRERLKCSVQVVTSVINDRNMEAVFNSLHYDTIALVRSG